MTVDLVTQLTVFALAVFVGFEVISKVPTMLHTPLMSGTNAIHGIVIVGAIIVVGQDLGGTLATVFGFIAVVFGTINVVGGFLVTDRMLQMFRRRPGREGGEVTSWDDTAPSAWDETPVAAEPRYAGFWIRAVASSSTGSSSASRSASV